MQHTWEASQARGGSEWEGGIAHGWRPAGQSRLRNSPLLLANGGGLLDSESRLGQTGGDVSANPLPAALPDDSRKPVLRLKIKIGGKLIGGITLTLPTLQSLLVRPNTERPQRSGGILGICDRFVLSEDTYCRRCMPSIFV